MSEETPKQTKRYVYIGTTEITAEVKGKQKKLPGVVLQNVDADGNLSTEQQYYAAKNFGGMSIGAVYEFVVEENGKRLYSQTRKYIEQFKDRDQIVQWRLAEEVKQIADRERKREKTESLSNNDLMFDVLKPIIVAYNQTDYRGQMVIELMLLRYLRSGWQRILREKKTL
jgi:hypothetical protein